MCNWFEIKKSLHHSEGSRLRWLKGGLVVAWAVIHHIYYFEHDKVTNEKICYLSSDICIIPVEHAADTNKKKQHMKFAIPQKCGVPLQPSMCIPLGASCAHQYRALLCGAATTNLFTILVQEHCKNYGFAEHETTANGTTFIRCDDYKWLLIKIRNQMQMSKAISAKTLRHRYHSVARK